MTNMSRIAGEKQRHRSRETGTVVIVFDGRAQDLDEDGGRWYTECLDHGDVATHATLALARWHAPFSNGWCSGCQHKEEEEGR